jgi:hypothetical protein
MCFPPKLQTCLLFAGNYEFSNGQTMSAIVIYSQESGGKLTFSSPNATIVIPKGQEAPVMAVGSVFTFQSTKNRFPSELSGEDNTTLLTTTLDFTLYSDLQLNGEEKVQIQFLHSQIKLVRLKKNPNVFYKLIIILIVVFCRMTMPCQFVFIGMKMILIGKRMVV